MADKHEDPNIRSIVRRYSNQVATHMTGNILAHALNEHEVHLQDRDNQAVEWRKWLEFDDPSRDGEMSGLQEAAKEAADLWRKLKLDLGDSSSDADSPPSVKTLSIAVSEAQDTWKASKNSGFGKAKERFSSFLRTMQQHEYLFSIIPKGDKYTSLLTGVLSTIVKASTNNETIAEGFSEALHDMGRDMYLVQRMSKQCNTPSMRQHVISLYREVFGLLSHAMSWYQSKAYRFRKAFNHKFYDETVKGRVRRIQSHLQRVRDEISLMAGDTLHLLWDRQGQSFHETSRHIGWAHSDISAQMEDLGQRLDKLRSELGQNMGSTLYANAEQVMIAQKTAPMPMLARVNAAAQGTHATEELALIRTKQQLEAFLTQLKKYAGGDDSWILASESSEGRPIIPVEVLSDLQRWLASRTSSLLWIESPAFVPDDRELARLATRVMRLSDQINIPCIGVFLQRSHHLETQELSQKEASLVILLYSLLTKLMMAMPAQLDSTHGLTEDQILRLDGTLDSVPVALKTIEELLAMMTPGLIVVLYAFDLVDGGVTCDALVELIRILQGQPDGKRLKTLIISRGRCISLLKTTKSDERSDATRMVMARGSSPLPGAVHARDTHLREPQF